MTDGGAPAEAECRLAYGLHDQFGRVCSRLGDLAICGACVGDLRPEEAARLTEAAKEGVPEE